MVVPKISVHDSEYLELVTETKEPEKSSPTRLIKATSSIISNSS